MVGCAQSKFDKMRSDYDKLEKFTNELAISTKKLNDQCKRLHTQFFEHQSHGTLTEDFKQFALKSCQTSLEATEKLEIAQKELLVRYVELQSLQGSER